MDKAYYKFYFPKKDYKIICDWFKLGDLISFKKFGTHGYESSKILALTEKGKYVISAYKQKSQRSKPKNVIMQEIKLLNLLKNLPVPKYIKGKEYVLDYKGYYIVVYPFIEGDHPKLMNEKKVYQLGEFLGKFHVIGRKFKTPLIRRRQFYNLNNKVLKKMDVYAKKQTHPLLKDNYEKIKQGVIDNRLPRGIERGPIHVDLNDFNELFKRDKLTGLIDFGMFYRDAYLIDIGKLIMWNCVKKEKVDLKLFKSALKGYEKHRKLPVREKNLIKKVVLFAIYSHIYVDYYHVPLKFVPQSYTLGLVKRFLPVARWLEEKKTSSNISFFF